MRRTKISLRTTFLMVAARRLGGNAPKVIDFKQHRIQGLVIIRGVHIARDKKYLKGIMISRRGAKTIIKSKPLYHLEIKKEIAF